MKIQHRAYQARTAQEAYESENNVLVVSPGGSGKTIIAALISRFAVRDGKRVIIISHRREIIFQTAETLSQLKPTILMSTEAYNSASKVVVASIQTLQERSNLPGADLVIVDEAHRSVAPGYKKVLDHYQAKGARLIGLSATPHRLDGKGLGGLFEELLEAAKPSQLLGKYISKPTTYSAPPELLPDLVGVKTRQGDFSPDDLVRRMNKDGLIAGIASTARKRLKGRRGVAFCCSIKHSKKVSEALNAVGIKAAHVDGHPMEPEERDEILGKLRQGKLQVVTNCMILSEGWDLQECDAVIMARPTRSLALYIQMANRCARIGKKPPIILDHACNTVMHNFSWIDRDWDMHSTIRADPGKPQLRACPACGCVNFMNATACTCCGINLVTKRELTPQEKQELELVEWTKREKARRRKHIEDFAKSKGFDQQWVDRVEQMWAV